MVTEVSQRARALFDEINKFSPSELICNEAFFMSGIDLEDLKVRYHFAVISAPGNPVLFWMIPAGEILREHFHVEQPGSDWDLADYEYGRDRGGRCPAVSV